jgi:hypothetical protein
MRNLLLTFVLIVLPFAAAHACGGDDNGPTGGAGKGAGGTSGSTVAATVAATTGTGMAGR